MNNMVYPKYLPGFEPETLKNLIRPFFSEINRMFPNKVIIWAEWNHEWDNAANYLCKELGYSRGRDFLEAYGYSISMNEPQSVNTNIIRAQSSLTPVVMPTNTPSYTEPEYQGVNYQRAIAAGERAISSLNKAKDELKKAQNWGIVDLVGGGLVTSLAKRSKINHAQEFMNEAKSEIRKFSNELKYYTGTESLEIDVDDFMKFADWFFDGFVVDFMVQSKINKALEQVNDAITKIQYILRQLS